MGLVQAFCAQGVKTPEWDCLCFQCEPRCQLGCGDCTLEENLHFLRKAKKRLSEENLQHFRRKSKMPFHSLMIENGLQVWQRS